MRFKGKASLPKAKNVYPEKRREVFLRLGIQILISGG